MPKLIIDAKRCKGCGLCVPVCPRKLLALSPSVLNARGVRPAALTDETACVSCAVCALMCPDVAITVMKEDKA